jgi:alcohol dehydrogenase (cytochrome c)
MWTLTFKSQVGLPTKPIVVDGVMYMTSESGVYALDARTGREIWSYRKPHTKADYVIRGVAALGDGIFGVSSDARLFACTATRASSSGRSRWPTPTTPTRRAARR